MGKACHELGLPLLPGVATGSEIMAAQEDGYTALKFFPALQAGGIAMLKAWQGPFGDVKFCPTGGVTGGNAGEFLRLANVMCVGGSWLTPPELMAAATGPTSPSSRSKQPGSPRGTPKGRPRPQDHSPVRWISSIL